MKNNQKTDLHFGPVGGKDGFTTAKTASFSDVNPHTVIRELLQNSIDAGKPVNRKPVKVKFEIECHSLSKIPGISSYRDVFMRARQDQRSRHKNGGNEFPDQAQKVIDSIDKALKEGKRSCKSLFVTDNGLGLNSKRMSSLIEDGQSTKSAGSGGSFGVGHNTAIVASNLRYVLYGGIDSDGTEIISGHAILASHKSKSNNNSIGGDGYLVKSLQQDFDGSHDFQTNGRIPTYLREKLNWIKSSEKTGAVVAITCFDDFGRWSKMSKKRFKDRSAFVGDIISKTSACSFFPALLRGELEIEFLCDGKLICSLNVGNVEKYLGEIKDEKRRIGSRSYLAGSKAYSACQAIRQGDFEEIDTGNGKIGLYVLKETELPSARVDLCRNGMWITDDIPTFSLAKIANRKPFHALVLLDSVDGGGVCKIVRDAEGPLHDNLEGMRSLPDKDKSQFRAAMTMVEDAIKRIVPESQGRSFFLPDELPGITSSSLSSDGTHRAGLGGTYEQVGLRPPASPRLPKPPTPKPPTPIPPTPPKPIHREFNKSGSVTQFKAIARYPSTRSCQAYITPQSDVGEAEIRFKIDDNYDYSWQKKPLENFAILSKVIIDGVAVPKDRYVQDKYKNSLSVRVSGLSGGAEIKVEFQFATPSSLSIPNNQKIVLDASIVSRSIDNNSDADAEVEE